MDCGAADGDPVDAIDGYRFYNPYTNEHLFTQIAAEIEHLLDAGWVDEDIEWLAPETSAMPMWRLFNPSTGEHLYTMNENEGYRTKSVGDLLLTAQVRAHEFAQLVDRTQLVAWTKSVVVFEHNP